MAHQQNSFTTFSVRLDKSHMRHNSSRAYDIPTSRFHTRRPGQPKFRKTYTYTTRPTCCMRLFWFHLLRNMYQPTYLPTGAICFRLDFGYFGAVFFYTQTCTLLLHRLKFGCSVYKYVFVSKSGYKVECFIFRQSASRLVVATYRYRSYVPTTDHPEAETKWSNPLSDDYVGLGQQRMSMNYLELMVLVVLILLLNRFTQIFNYRWSFYSCNSCDRNNDTLCPRNLTKVLPLRHYEKILVLSRPGIEVISVWLILLNTPEIFMVNIT